MTDQDRDDTRFPTQTQASTPAPATGPLRVAPPPHPVAGSARGHRDHSAYGHTPSPDVADALDHEEKRNPPVVDSPPPTLEEGATAAAQGAGGAQDKCPRLLPLCIVTGLSGSGKSTAMQVFEDLGYFTVDGLPASMAPEMVDLMKRPSMAHFKGMALGLDIRQSAFLDEIEDVLDTLRRNGHIPQLIFFEAETKELMRRYATTRRPHPLEREGIGLEAAVLSERKRLERLRGRADMVVNTTRFSIHDLRRVLQKRFREGGHQERSPRVLVLSFGFKHEVPRDADYVFDLRFLPNPYFVSELRSRTGLDQEVADYVFATPKAREFLTRLQDLIFYILPLMELEGRYRLTLAFGCTGGRHRSVAVAEAMARSLCQLGFPVTVEHRHMALG